MAHLSSFELWLMIALFYAPFIVPPLLCAGALYWWWQRRQARKAK